MKLAERTRDTQATVGKGLSPSGQGVMAKLWSPRWITIVCGREVRASGAPLLVTASVEITPSSHTRAALMAGDGQWLTSA